jgi:hypothetical protein
LVFGNRTEGAWVSDEVNRQLAIQVLKLMLQQLGQIVTGR